jgi:energy-coupling factor transporter transmembrane protein EcfT
VGPVVLLFLVFCVVVFGGGYVVLIFLVFCVVVFGGDQIPLHRKLKR